MTGPTACEAVSRQTVLEWIKRNELNPRRGRRADEWSVRVSQGWRVTFRMDGPDVRAVRYENYHH